MCPNDPATAAMSSPPANDSPETVPLWFAPALVLLAFIPRWIMSLQHPLICTDAVFYLERAAALENGDLQFAFSRLGLNPLPWMLVSLHRLGLDWEQAGAAISLVAASLAIFPLWALTRRLFNSRVALVTALLYVVHPELIEWSPEIIRDPLFWLLFLTSLDLIHQVSCHPSWPKSLAAGLAMSLAILTRFEGWFLIVPLVVWTALSAYRTPTVRWLRAGNVVACLAVLPLFVVVTNLTLLRSHPHWELGRLDHLTLAGNWLGSWIGGSSISPPTDSNAALTQPAIRYISPDESRWTLRAAAWGFSHTVRRGFRNLYLAAALLGSFIALRRRTFDAYPLWGLAALQLLATWIYFWQLHEINARYVLPALLVVLPYVAIALLAVADALASHVPSNLVARTRTVLVAGVLLCATTLGLSEAWSRTFDGRYLKAHLGTYLQARFGAGLDLLCSENLERMVGYYAAADHRALPAGYGGPALVALVNEQQPDVIALWLRPPGLQRYAHLLADPHNLGYQLLSPHDLPPCCDEVAILVRHDRLAIHPSSTAFSLAATCNCTRRVAEAIPQR